MKAGCLFLLAVMAGAYFGYQQLLAPTALGDKWWVPALLALGAGMFIGNIQGVFLALKQRAASNKPRSEWKDGDLVTFSGRIQSSRSPVIAPFSNTQGALVEYRIRDFQDESNGVNFCGFMMNRCTVQTLQGAVNLIGYPLLQRDQYEVLDSEEEVGRAAEFLQKTTFKELSGNPLSLIPELNKMLSDKDGEVAAHFRKAGTDLLDPMTEEERNDEEPAKDRTELITRRIDEDTYFLEEFVLKNGTEVTACGTFHANRQAVDIGAGLKTLSHSLRLGTAAEVTGSTLRQAVVGTIIFAAIFIAGNYFVLKEIGLIQ